jgi:UDP-N-acetyl-D-galactosamine dehydrogenase
MGKYVAESVVKKLIASDLSVKGAKIAILGFTFKENCPDTRNSKIIDIYNELGEYGIVPTVVDTTADADEAKRLYGIEFGSMDDVRDMDAVIIAVAHNEFMGLNRKTIDGFFNKNNKIKVLADIKGILDKKDYETEDYSYWRL